MTTHRSPKPAGRPGPTQPVERAVTAALVLSVVAGVGWVGGMIYTVLEWPL
ncbi:morphogenic membrane protein MmpA [Streptomyces fagopyri]|uniref:morphogenic membrane protein MmpA n=1 Tax=Streptomyces fagopyri TaxID=2662397 RepID=UPI0033DC816B